MVAVGASIAASLIRLLGFTWRVEVDGAEHLERLRSAGQPFLFVVWHGRIVVPIHRHRDTGVVAMVSLSRDGDLTAGVLSRLGYDCVRGSSSRGGNAAYHALVGRIEAGASGAIIPDGPRGPARVLKPGLLYLAQQTQIPILPLGASATPSHCFRSWDGFLLPLPMARSVISYGPPVEVPHRASASRIEQLRSELERTLCQLEARADRSCGREPHEPATAPGPAES